MVVVAAAEEEAVEEAVEVEALAAALALAVVVEEVPHMFFQSLKLL